MIGRILALIPKNLLAFLAIVGGIAFIIAQQHPHTLCDSQTEVIRQNQQRFLYKDPKAIKIETTLYQKLRDQCIKTNDPGGCYEWFQELRTMNHDLGTLTSECATALADEKEYSTAVKEPIKYMAQIAWGTAPPSSYMAKFGWLDTADITLFCHLRDRYIIFYGEDAWEAFRTKLMLDLPGAKDLPRNQVKDLTILNENCARYP